MIWSLETLFARKKWSLERKTKRAAHARRGFQPKIELLEDRVVPSSVPAVSILKLTNGTDNDTGTGPEVPVNSTVIWSYFVTNSGSTPLANVAVSDDREGMPRETTIAFAEREYNIGDLNHNGLLDLNETWEFTASGIARIGQYENVGTVVATTPDGGTEVTASNPDRYYGVGPDIKLVKLTNDTDNNSGTGPQLTVDSPVTWTYLVTNTGFLPLTNIRVVDDNGTPDDSSDDFMAGTLDSLSPGATHTFTATGAAILGQYTNTATASGTATLEEEMFDVEASDVDSYFGVAPAAHPDIQLVKRTNGSDNNSGTGPVVSAGSTVTWSYQVTNTGDVTLNNVSVLDDNGTPLDTTDDFTPGTIAILAAGDSVALTHVGTVTVGQYVNTAIASGTDSNGETVSASDNDRYFGAQPGIQLVKLTNNSDNNSGTGPVLPAGSSVIWSYIVSNTGNVALNNVSVVDDNGTPGNTGDDIAVGTIASLAVGATQTLNATGTATVNQYVNTATANGTDSIGQAVSASDTDRYFGAQPSLQLVMLTNGTDNNSPTGPVVLAGSTVTWSYIVTNTGNITLTNVLVVDDNGTPLNLSDDFSPGTIASLAPGATYSLFATGTAATGQYTNTGTSTGTATYTSGTGMASASDVENHYGYQLVTIGDLVWKDTNANGIQNSGEAGIAGVTLTLTGTDFQGVAVTHQATTDGTGRYQFTEAPGTYTVTVNSSNFSGSGALVGYLASPTLQGSNRSVDSNPSPSTITLGSGGSDQTIDFGFFVAGGSLSGTKFLDVTGNGFSADDTPLGGIVINLYKDLNSDGVLTSADGSAVATKTTALSGNIGTYSFSNLASGTYFVQEVVPSAYVRTGPASASYYTATVTPGSAAGNLNFANALKGDLSVLTDVTYDITHSNGSTVTVTDLRGNTNQGDTVTVNFTVTGPPGSSQQFTLVTYTAPGSSFDPNTANQQKIFDQDTGTFGPGTHSLTVKIPDSYYQIDFVAGAAIDRFGPAGSNIFFSAQTRLESADNDGSVAVVANAGRISGTKYRDKTGNGLTADDTIQNGTTVKLYRDANNNGTLEVGTDTYIGSKVTAGDGSYMFSNLTPGTAKYFVKETAPSGYVQTWPTSGTYTVTLGANSVVTGKDFADFLKIDTTAVTGISYKVTHNGVTKTYSTLPGRTHAGDTVKVTFTIAAGQTRQLSLVSYNAPTSTFNASLAHLQTIHQQATGTWTGGTHTLTVTIPNGNYQINFIAGPAINQFGPAGSNIFYSPQSRLLGSDGGGTMTLMASGSDGVDSLTGSADAPLVGAFSQLRTGQILVAVDGLEGDLAADQMARIEDAMAALNVNLSPYGIMLTSAFPDMVESADIHIRLASTTVIGGAAQGILGVAESGGDITLVNGWNWYLGEDPAAVGTDQYDFQTVVTHELGHALGFGHSHDTTSVMYSELAPGEARRVLSENDLVVLHEHEESGPEPLMASPFRTGHPSVRGYPVSGDASRDARATSDPTLSPAGQVHSLLLQPSTDTLSAAAKANSNWTANTPGVFIWSAAAPFSPTVVNPFTSPQISGSTRNQGDYKVAGFSNLGAKGRVQDASGMVPASSIGSQDNAAGEASDPLAAVRRACRPADISPALSDEQEVDGASSEESSSAIMSDESELASMVVLAQVAIPACTFLALDLKRKWKRPTAATKQWLSRKLPEQFGV